MTPITLETALTKSPEALGDSIGSIELGLASEAVLAALGGKGIEGIDSVVELTRGDGTVVTSLIFNHANPDRMVDTASRVTAAICEVGPVYSPTANLKPGPRSERHRWRGALALMPRRNKAPV